MASLRDHVLQGTLTQAEIDRETTSRPGAVNDPDANGLTPLLLACLKGHLDAVTLLIAAGADVNHRDKNQCTALNLAARTTSPDQAAIIRALLRTDKVEVDATCLHLKGNTPLMSVIQQTRDIDSITELVNYGASVTTKNDLGKTAKALAEELGDPRVIAALKPKSDKQGLFSRAIGHIIKTVQRVLFILNKPLKSGVRFLSAWFGYTPPEIGSRPRNGPEQRQQPDKASVADPDKRQEPEGHETLARPETPPEDREEKKILHELANIGNHIKKSEMSKFTGLDDDFLETLTAKTMALRNDAQTDLGKPANLPDMINLAMYQPVIYCDDSGSMRGASYRDQADVVARIARVATRIIPDNMGIELRFINNEKQFSNRREEQILTDINKVKPDGSTPLGKNLRKRILEPLIYQRKGPLQRPYLISIITDGRPDNQEEFNQALRDCKKELDQAQYPEFAVIFLISQVGDTAQARGFLEDLKNDPVLKTITHCITTSLDSKLREAKGNERELEVWLLKRLVEPIYRWGPDFIRSSSEEDKKTV